jgi:hypothetical protein
MRTTLRRAGLVLPLLVAVSAAVGRPVGAQVPYGTPPPSASPSPTVVSGAGDITPVVNAYRVVLGDPNNGGAVGRVVRR